MHVRLCENECSSVRVSGCENVWEMNGSCVGEG